jgi:phage baseplate assembly protein W
MANEVAIALPFSLNTLGVVNSSTSQSKIWEDRVRSVLGTTLRERVMRPNFGTIIPFSLFDGITDAASQVKQEISSAFSAQLPLLKLNSASVNFDTYTNNMTVEVVYDLPNNEKITTNLGYVSIDGTIPAYEELL